MPQNCIGEIHAIYLLLWLSILLFWTPRLHDMYLPPRPSCFAWKSRTLWRPRTVYIACTLLGVSAFATILRSHTLARGPLHQGPGKSRMGLSFPNLSASRQSKRRKILPLILPAFSVAACFLTSTWKSTTSPPPFPSWASVLCRTSLIFSAHRVHVDHHLFTESPSFRRFFLDSAVL